MPQQNLKIPVRTEGLTMLSTGHEPVVRNVQTAELATDRATGQTVYRVYVTVILPGEVRPQMWAIKVAGEPKGLEPGMAVSAKGLVATEYEIEGRRGIGFRADAVVPADASARTTSSPRQAA